MLQSFKRITLFISIILITNVIVFGSNNPKPFVIPELKEWKSYKGVFSIQPSTKVLYPANNLELKQVAEAFANDYNVMFGTHLTVSSGKAAAGDIEFAIKSDKKLGEEGYTINITNRIVVTAPQTIGAYWASRTLLQIAEQDNQQRIPQGSLRDYPDYSVRGFMLDCGRKYIPMKYLNDLVKIMSYYKMNTLQIHLNDNGFKQYFQHDWQKTYAAFRLECDTYPGLAAYDGYYTKDEFRDFQKNALNYGVEIIPEIDVPAHSLCFSQYTDGIASEKYGEDHLDLFAPKTYSFIDALLKEYLEGDDPVFVGPRFNIGTDEYSNENKEVVEKFRYFTDYYIKQVESYGKQACMWGALSHAKGDTPVKVENVIINNWYNGFSDPKAMIDLGYKLISMNDWQVYIVPGAGYYHDYLNIEKLYNNWTPNIIGGDKFQEKHPSILGGMFAVWNDIVGNGITVKDIHHRLYPVMQTLSTKMWAAHGTNPSFDIFDKKRHDISEAPGVNQLGRIGNEPAKVYESSVLKPKTNIGLDEIGYDYTVSFTLNPKAEVKGTALFTSPNATFYLADPINGFMGYERDGYLNTFRYTLRDGEPVKVQVTGDNKSITLKVNDKLVDNMNIQKIYFNGGKDSLSYYRTLVFPLEESGSFNSKISDLEIYNYCKE